MNPWIHAGHMPVLLLMLVAATAAIMLLAEHYHSKETEAVIARARGWRRPLIALFSVACILLAGVVIWVTAAFVGFVFGPFYLILSAAMLIFVIIPAMGIPPLYRKIEALNQRQLTWGTLIVIFFCFASTFLYIGAVNALGWDLELVR